MFMVITLFLVVSWLAAQAMDMTLFEFLAALVSIGMAVILFFLQFL